jgi:hypothetical protein
MCFFTHIMKKHYALFILLCGIVVGTVCLLTRPAPAQPQEVLIQGRSVAAWVNELDLGHRPGDTNAAEYVLISAGPKVLPILSRLLVGRESVKDMVIRLPGVPTETKNLQAINSETLMFKARAVSVIGPIIYRNPSAPEVQETIPFLITALGSGSREIRFRSAQALHSAGKGASNAIPRLVACTRDEDSGVRMCAVEALGRIDTGTPLVIQALTRASSDTNTDVSVTAKEALQALHPVK